MQILNVEEKYDGKKICTYLLYKFPCLKQSTLYNWTNPFIYLYWNNGNI